MYVWKSRKKRICGKSDHNSTYRRTQSKIFMVASVRSQFLRVELFRLTLKPMWSQTRGYTSSTMASWAILSYSGWWMKITVERMPILIGKIAILLLFIQRSTTRVLQMPAWFYSLLWWWVSKESLSASAGSFWSSSIRRRRSPIWWWCLIVVLRLPVTP